MNKVFRVIWSEAHGAWVAVSEMTKSHSKRSKKSALAIALAAGSLMGVSGYASATSMGDHNPSIGAGSIVIGQAIGECSAPAAAMGDRSVSIGCETGAFAEGDNQTNLGYQAGLGSEGNFNTAIGSNAGENVDGSNNTAVGLSSGGTVAGSDNAAFGMSSGGGVTGSGNAAFGTSSGGGVTGSENLSLGNGSGSSAKGNANVAVGLNAGAGLTGSNNASLGRDAGKTVAGSDNAAFGSNAGEAIAGNRNTGFGRAAGKGVKGDSNTSLGDGAGMFMRGNGNFSGGLSAGQSIHGDHNVMLGNKSSTVGSSATKNVNRTVVIGSEAETHHDDTVALGTKAKAEHENSVALGHASATKTLESITAATVTTTVLDEHGNPVLVGGIPKTTTHTYDGFTGTATGVVSVGSGGSERQIVNVAPGAITAVSTDAINGSQLYSVATGLTQQINNINTAGGWTLGSQDATGAAQNLAVDAGGKVNLDAGKNMQVISEKDALTGDITTTFATKNDVEFDSVTTAGVVVDADGVTIAYDDGTGTIVTGPSMTRTGINAGDLHITNVKAGTADTHGVNVSQLKGLGSVIGGVSIDNTTGAVTGPTFKVNNTNHTTINKAIEELDKGWTLSDGTVAGTTQVQAGDRIAIQGGDNIDVTLDATSGEMVVKTNPNVTHTSVTTGNTVMNDNGLTITGGPSFTKTEINAGGNKITNVEAGVALTDAVNVSQLDSVKGIADNANKGWNVSVDGGAAHNVAPDTAVDFKGGKNIELTQNGGEITINTTAEVEFDDVKVGDVTINKDTGITVGDTNINKDGVKVGDVSITVGGIHAGDKKITGVANGLIAKDSKDAVNGGQIHDMQVEIDLQAGGWELTDGKGGKQQVKAGDTVAIKGGDNINVEFNAAGEMIVATNPDVKHESVTIEYTNANGDLVTGPSMTRTGIDAGNLQITNLSKGTDGTDGVNVDQLKGLGAVIGDVNIDAVTGAVTGPTFNVNTTTHTTVEAAINELDKGWTFAAEGKDYQVKAGDKVEFAAGNNIEILHDGAGKATVQTKDLVNFTQVTTGDTVMNSNGLTIVGGPSITKGGVDAGGSKVTNVAAGDISSTSTDAINGSQLNATNSRVTINENNISNLDNRVTNNEGNIVNLDKRVTVNEGDIVNLDKRVTVNEGDIVNLDGRVTTNEGDINNLQIGKEGMFQVSQDYNAPAPKPTGTKSAAGGAGAIASGDNSTAVGNDAQATANNSTSLGNSALASHHSSVALGHASTTDRDNSVSVGAVGGERQITHVAAGVAPTDAVNVSQLDELGGRVNQYFNAASKRIDKVDNNARAGIAAAMAAGTLPQSTLPGKSMVTVGASTYRGESALALGVSRLSDNARTVIKANASTDSRGNAGAAVGAGWHW